MFRNKIEKKDNMKNVMSFILHVFIFNIIVFKANTMILKGSDL